MWGSRAGKAMTVSLTSRASLDLARAIARRARAFAQLPFAVVMILTS
jgi:hypothetical protein